MGIYEEDLFKYIINELYTNKSPMGIESIVNLLFSFSRIEKIIGASEFSNQLDGQQVQIMRYFIRDLLYTKRLELEEFINADKSYSLKLTNLTMVLKALGFNRRILEDNFHPYILETIQMSMGLMKKILEQLQPDSIEVTYVTYANLLSALTFDTHPKNKTHEDLLSID